MTTNPPNLVEMLSRVPAPARWLPEPLVLPVPRAAAEWPEAAAQDRWSPDVLVWDRASRAGGAAEIVEPTIAVLWYRWIVGHQVSFILWQLLARALAAASQTPAPPVELLGEMTRYVRGYCGMLLYAASCSRDVYREVIRPSMARCHPAFSGSWALDFRPVAGLLRGRVPDWPRTPERGELERAIKLAQAAHHVVAAKLVPDGPSLLQRSGLAMREISEDRQRLGAIYDEYFMVARAAISLPDVAVQLADRLEAIDRDIARHGFFSARDADRPAELASADLVELERQLAALGARA